MRLLRAKGQLCGSQSRPASCEIMTPSWLRSVEVVPTKPNSPLLKAFMSCPTMNAMSLDACQVVTSLVYSSAELLPRPMPAVALARATRTQATAERNVHNSAPTN